MRLLRVPTITVLVLALACAGRAEEPGRGAPSPPRTARVYVGYAGTPTRTPAAGIRVVALPPPGESGEASGVTGADGTVALRIPWARGGQLVVRDGTGFPVAYGNLPWDESSEASVALQREHQLFVRIRRGGRPFLPRAFRLRVGDQVLVPWRLSEDEAVVWTSYEADPIAPPPIVTLEAEGRSFYAALPPRCGSTSDSEAIVDLDPAGPPLEVEVRLPDRPVATPFLTLRRFDAVSGAWEPDRCLSWGHPWAPGTTRVVRLEGLPAGRYRPWAAWSAIASEEADLAVRGAPARVRVDLSDYGRLEGRVEVPPGTSRTGAQVRVWDGAGTEGDSRAGASVAPDGTFWVEFPEGRPVTLQAAHPWCVPDARAGTATVTTWRETVVLRLSPGTTAELRLLDPDGRPVSGGRDGPSLLVRFVGPAALRNGPVRWAEEQSGTWRFGGYAPGRAEVWLDDSVHAPLALGEVVLRDGTTDLGEHRLTRGGTIRVRVRADEDAPPPSVGAIAAWLDGPVNGFTRHSRPDDDGTLVIRGLLPGRHRVDVFSHGGRVPTPPGRGTEQVVEVRAGEETEVLVDYRRDALDAEVEGR